MPVQKTTREEMLRHCIRVFRRQGYYRTSMADLAQETGLTKGVFYHHFAGKEQIMLAALEMSAAYFRNRIFALAFDASLPLRARIDEMANRACEAFTKGSGGCFFANTVLETAHIEDTFLPAIRSFFAEWEAAFVHLIRLSQPDADAGSLARRLIADIEGSLILMQLHQDETYAYQAFERARHMIRPYAD
ncbi:MAG: TetR/AcrR family transcriptional regulator [Bacteroidia bacterium]|nr:TetR/AcrR family transcriptional regulator [Bacteroidia bacterium]